MSIIWKYLDKRSAAVDALKDYSSMKFIIEHTDDEIKAAYEKMGGVSSPQSDGMPRIHNKHQVLVRGENVKLTLSEFRIVALLGKHAGKVLTYDAIIKELWGPRAGSGNQILRVNMANIRRKIERNPAEPEYLFTEVGVGYRLAEGE